MSQYYELSQLSHLCVMGDVGIIQVSNVLILYNHNPFFSLYLCQDVPFIKSIPLPSDVNVLLFCWLSETSLLDRLFFLSVTDILLLKTFNSGTV